MTSLVNELIHAGDAQTPAWLERNLQRPGRSCYVGDQDQRLHYLVWGQRDQQLPGLLFVPGYRAHAGWWDFIAPMFADRFHVVVMELPGMGDSAHRKHYTAADMSTAIKAVIEHGGLWSPIGVGHSYGGSRLLSFASERPGLLSRVIVLDSYVHFASQGSLPSFPRTGSHRAYPSLEAALLRFRLLPEQPLSSPALLNYIASGSLRETDAGWIWKFDVDLPGAAPMELDGAALLSRVDVPVHLVWGEHSVVASGESMRRIAAALPLCHEPIMIPDAHHHLMLDQPIAVMSVLQALLA